MSRESLEMPSSYILKAIASLALLLMSLSSYADVSWYVGAGFSRVSVSNEDGRDFRPGGLDLRAGFRVSKFVDVELLLAGNTEDEHSIFDEYSASIAGLLVKRYFPLSTQWAVYGSLGGSVTELVQTVNGTELSDGNRGLSAGVGVESIFYDNLNVLLDFTIHSYSQDSPTIAATVLGLKWNF